MLTAVFGWGFGKNRLEMMALVGVWALLPWYVLFLCAREVEFDAYV